jgi:hypothetical protein
MVKNMVRCFLCDSQFQYGTVVYDGKWKVRCQMYLCANCNEANSEGCLRNHEERVLAHLRAVGVEPPGRNAAGLLPLD